MAGPQRHEGTPGQSSFTQLSNKLGRVTISSVMNAPLWALGFSIVALLTAGSVPTFNATTRIVIDVIASVCLAWAIGSFLYYSWKNPRFLMSESYQLEAMKLEQQGYTAPIIGTALTVNPVLESQLSSLGDGNPAASAEEEA